MSTFVWHNGERLASLLEDVPCEIVFDEVGVAGGTMHYQCFWEIAPSLVSAMQYHPDFNWLKRKSARITREEANMARVAVTFEGIPPEEEGDEDKATYSIQGSTSSEPIETHEKFADFAGTPDGPWLNGAKFKTQGDDVGKFLGFFSGDGGGGGDDPPEELPVGAPPPFRAGSQSKIGVKSFLEGGMVFSETKVKSRGSDGFKAKMTKLGKIDNPPNVEQYVDVPEGRDWLLVSCNLETVGDGVKTTRQWRLSGRRGWDTDIYT